MRQRVSFRLLHTLLALLCNSMFPCAGFSPTYHCHHIPSSASWHCYVPPSFILISIVHILKVSIYKACLVLLIVALDLLKALQAHFFSCSFTTQSLLETFRLLRTLQGCQQLPPFFISLTSLVINVLTVIISVFKE